MLKFGLQTLLLLCSLSLFAQTNPTPFDLSSGNYNLIQWPSDALAGTYPNAMRFQICSAINADLNAPTTGDYSGIYNNNNGPRFNGLASGGFYIAGVYNSTPTVGAVVLALNSSGRNNLQVSFQVSTILSGNPANVRLQYRPASNNATWSDVPGPVEYVSNGTTSINSTTFNVNLSNLIGTQIDNRPAFQLRWKYYRTSGTGANDCAIAIDEINVTSQALSSPSISTGLMPALNYCVTPTLPTPLVLPFYYSPAIGYSNSDFTVELSDTSGSFDTPVSVGVVSSNNSGSQFVTVTIPQNTATGRGYKLRVRNQIYGVIGNDNGSPFTINLVPVSVTTIIPNTRYKSALLNWSSPASCWDEVMVVSRQGALPTGIPTGNGLQYSAEANFGLGSQVGDGYVVYKGTGTSVEIKSLTPEISYGLSIWTRYGNDWIAASPISVITPSISFDNAKASKISNAEYFWNQDPGAGNGIPFTVTDGNFSSAFEQLSKNGLQAPRKGRSLFTARIKDGNGNWSSAFYAVINVDSVDLSRGFPLQKIINSEYWWNNDPGVGNGTQLIAADGNLNAAFDHLFQNGIILPRNGRSTFNIRLRDGSNNWSPTFSTLVNVDSFDISRGYPLQKLIQAEYWWNNDSLVSNPLLAFDGNINSAFESLYVNGLTAPRNGRSIFNLRVKDGTNHWSHVFRTLVNVDSFDINSGYPLPKIIQAEYWWNIDPGVGNATPMIALDGNFSSAFENIFRNGIILPRNGKSTFNVRIRANDNIWSEKFTTIVNVDSFDVSRGYPLQKLIQAEFWWNNDPGVGNGEPILALDGNLNSAFEYLIKNRVAAQRQGVSTFNLRVKDNLNKWSDKFTTIVNIDSVAVKPIVYAASRIKQAEYFWDTDPGEGNGTQMRALDNYSNSPFEKFINPQEIPQTIPNGIHLLGMRSKDAYGSWGPVHKTTVDVNLIGNTFAVYTNPAYTIRCQGQSVSLNALGAVSYSWSPADGLSSTSGSTVVATPTQTTTYTVTGTNSFGLTSTATVTIVVTSPASILGPTSIDLCPGQSVQLSSSSALGNYWTTGETSQTITITQPGTYTLISENGCGVNASSVVVNQLPIDTPIISASGPTQFCIGDAVVLTASEGVSFLWSNGSTDQSVYITESGNYTVTVTPDGGCPATSTATEVTASPVPEATITASGATTICSGNFVTLNAPLGSGLSYEWLKDGVPLPNSNAPTFNVISSGFYSVIVTFRGCAALSNPIYVTVTPLPNAVITPAGSTTICSGGSVLLQGPSGNGVAYQWKLNGSNISGATSQNYNATAAGNYTLTISANACTATSTSVSITVSSLPSANITTSGALTFCQGASVTFTASAGTGFSYQWFKNSVAITNATNQTYTANSAGVYYVVVTNNGCQSTSSTRTVVVNPLPTAQITPAGPTGLCTGGSVVLNATTGTGYSYQWKLNGINLSGAISSSYTAFQAGNYTVTVTATACPVTSSIVPVQIGSPITASITASGTTTFCSGKSVLLSANTGTGLTYQWKKDGNEITGATSSTYSATTSGRYTAVVFNNGCPSTSNTIDVTVTIPFPVNITANGSTNICTGGSVLLQGEQVAGYVYDWRLNEDTIPGAHQYQYAAFQAGSYTLSVTFGGCTVTSEPIVVTEVFSSIQVTPDSDQTICQGDSIQLQAAIGVGYTYQWLKGGSAITGATSSAYVAKSTGVYSVSITSPQCSGISNAVTINVSTSNAATISISITAGSNPTCSGNSITFTANVTNGGINPTYQWKVNGVNVGTNSNTFTSNSLLNGSLVNCVLNSSIANCSGSSSSTSNSIQLSINTATNSSTTQTACGSYTWNGQTYSNSGTYTRSYNNGNGCPSVDTLKLTINSGTFTSTTQAACGSYTWNGQTYSNSGTYTRSYTNGNGCPSVDTLHLTINSGTFTSTTQTACGSYTWNGQTYSNSGTYTRSYNNGNGCPSVDTLKLTITQGTFTSTTQTACGSYTWNGQTYSNSGTYTRSYNNGNGCSSVDTLKLTITQGTFTSTTQTACGSYTWNGQTYSTSGTYTRSYTNGNGCPSVDTLKLTINSGTFTSTTQSACGSYTWNGQTYSNSGTYTRSYNNGNGCPSVDTLHLTINSGTFTSTNQTACGSYTWNGQTYSNSGTYTRSYNNGNGCPSVDTLHLTINSGTFTSTNQTACGSYTWNGQTYSNSGTYTRSYNNGNGCSSVDTLKLTITQGTFTSTTQSACGSYTWNGQTYSNSGTYTRSYNNGNGCSSVDTLKLTITQGTFTSTTQTACGSYTWNGQTYSNSGTYTKSYTNGNGCPSVDTLILTINNGQPISSIITACDSYTWNGITYTNSGTYTYSRTGNSGCSAIDTLKLIIKQSTNSSTSQTACESFIWNGQTYSNSGTYTRSYTNGNGCPSVDTLYLTINRGTFSSTAQTACGSYTWFGTTYSNSDTYIRSYTNGNGCPSVDTLYLTINRGTFSSTSQTACNSYTWFGTTYSNSGTYIRSYTNMNGCPSVDTLYLTINRGTFSSTAQTACGSYTWFGTTYSNSGTYIRSYTNGNGCPSVDTLRLTITAEHDYYWIGGVSSAWEEPANWSCGMVPNAQSNIYVQDGAQRSLEVQSQAVCNRLYLRDGKTVRVYTGYRLRVFSNP